MPRPPRARPTRSILLAALATVAVVGVLTLAPRSIVGPARGAVMGAMDAATSPLRVAIGYGDAEIVLNLFLFVPLGALLALLLSPRAWPLPIAAGLALSAAVEIAQRAVPGRVPDTDDILWNTVGAAVGVAVVTVPRVMATALPRGRQRARSTRT
ncbi:VanZ family protein [Microbacterium sp. P01]|uniref:VanZ family protein n=1 Tax=Microbacterium sp. P01 TaxID=3366261 RepID=UPI00366DB6CD